MRRLLQAIFPTENPKFTQKTEDIGRILQLLALGPVVGVMFFLGIKLPSVQLVVWGAVIGPGCLAGVGYLMEKVGEIQRTGT